MLPFLQSSQRLERMKLFRNISLLFIGLGLALPTHAEWTDIFGEKARSKKIELGSVLFHVKDLYDKESSTRNMHFKQSIVGSYNGWVATVYNNSHDQLVVAAGTERHWRVFPLWHGQATFGYRAGLVYGYCMERNFSARGLYVTCRKEAEGSLPSTQNAVLPMFQLIFDYSQENFGINIGTTFFMFTASAVFNF